MKLKFPYVGVASCIVSESVWTFYLQ